MFEKSQIIISEDIEGQQMGSITVNKVVNPTLALEAPIIPTALTFSVTVLSSGGNYSEIETVEIIVEDKDRQQVFSTGETAIALPPQITNINFSVGIRNVLINNEGKYYAVAKFNGEKEIEHEFLINKIVSNN